MRDSKKEISQTLPKITKEGRLQVPSLAVPSPDYISEEARLWLAASYSYYESSFGASAKKQSRAKELLNVYSYTNNTSKFKREQASSMYDSRIERKTIGGIEVDLVHPESATLPSEKSKIIIHLCGGVAYLGSELVHTAIMVANLAGVRVAVPRYRYPPKCTWSEAINDVASVYTYLLDVSPKLQVGIFGESSGALLSILFTEHIIASDLQTPGVLGILGGGLPGYQTGSILGSLLDFGVYSKFILGNGWSGEASKPMKYDTRVESSIDLSCFPPTTLVSGTRDSALSATINLYNLLCDAGVDADLNVYEGMPHAHHTSFHTPEGREVLEELARFLNENLS